MAKKRVVDIVEEQLLQFLDEKNLELVDIEFLKEGKDWFLRIYIDDEEGVSLNKCQLVSEFISERLDELDPIEQGYFLEVSSPGLERPLKNQKDYEKNKGNLIEVSLYEAVDGQKTIEGILEDFDQDYIKISSEKNNITIEKTNIAKAKPIISI